ncbi:MAG: hypothetical protein AB9907_09265 [Flexilinea sp.]
MDQTKRRFFPLLLIAVLIMLSACSTRQTQTVPAAFKQGMSFQAGGSGYLLKEIVRVTDYDTDANLGYGVIVLMENGSAPVIISMSKGDTGFSPKSLIQMTLDDGNGGIYESANIAFKANDDDSIYLGYARFEFSLPKNVNFPKTGTFKYVGDAAEDCTLSFEGMEIAEAESVVTAPAEN